MRTCSCRWTLFEVIKSVLGVHLCAWIKVKRDVGLRGEGKKKERVEKVGTHTSFSREQKNKKNRADEQIEQMSQIGQIRRADQMSRSDQMSERMGSVRRRWPGRTHGMNCSCSQRINGAMVISNTFLGMRCVREDFETSWLKRRSTKR